MLGKKLKKKMLTMLKKLTAKQQQSGLTAKKLAAVGEPAAWERR